MKRIILHWSAGTYTPNKTDFEHYHFLVDNAGRIFKGKYTPEDNLNCRDGKYAMHTGGGNTESIGIALCAMLGFKGRTNIGKYPILQTQAEAAYKLMAQLCVKYKIKVSPDTVLTHYEFGLKNPDTSSKGKIDINFLPFVPNLKAEDVGGYIRGKVEWYVGKI